MNAAHPAEPALLRSFDSFDHAAAARHALVAAGVDAAAITIDVLQDEAGPVEGNFLVGNGRPSPGARSRIAPAGGPDAPYEANLARVITRGTFLLKVQTIAPTLRADVEALLAQSPGVDVEALADRARNLAPPAAG